MMNLGDLNVTVIRENVLGMAGLIDMQEIAAANLILFMHHRRFQSRRINCMIIFDYNLKLSYYCDIILTSK